MQEIKYPLILKGRILKKEMLYLFRDYPRDVLEAYNENLSDGIVCGLTPIVDREIINFSKGIVKFGGNLYVLDNPTTLDYGETEVDVMIKLSFYDEVTDSDYITQFIEIDIDTDLNIYENQLELGRFKLKKGAYLRSDYRDLFDFTTEYNTINVVHVQYAGYGEYTLSNNMLKYFAREALNSRTQNAMDINFCMLCLNNDRIERQVIYHYIAYRLEEELKPMSNKDMHDKLVKILGVIKKDSSGLKRTKTPGQKILID